MQKKQINDLPIIKLKPFERLWLEEVYTQMKANVRPSYRIIRIKLHNLLPSGFTIKDIDSRILNSFGEQITLLGIIALEKNYSIIEKADNVILSVRELILKNPDKTIFETQEIAELTKLEKTEVGLIMHLISNYGHLYSSASMTANNGFIYERFDIGQENYRFEWYLNFQGVAKLISDSFEEKNNEKEFAENENLKSQATPINKSIFKSPIPNIDINLCFVLMPFTENWSDRIYKKYIRENIEFLGLQCLRADNLNGPIVIEDIWIKINQAAFIIADVTGKNANVMYELGIVHAIGKPAILITQNIHEVPFDFKHLRHYQYEDNTDGFERFSVQLKEAIKSTYNEYYPLIGI